MSSVSKTSSTRNQNSNDQAPMLTVPQSLNNQLTEFRSRVWTSKLGEAFLIGIVGVLLAFLTVYAFDRFLDTPREARTLIFFGSLALWLAVPWALHKWVWRNRRLEQLARLLRVREPGVGDQLLSVIELSENQSEQARSRTLCAAAIAQVAETAKERDFKTAAPPTRLRGLGMVLAVSGLTTIILAVLFPSAASNAWARFSTPWRDIPRYTFTEIQPLPPTMVVAHGEATPLEIQLKSESRWRPATATLQIGNLPPIAAPLNENVYQFELPPQTSDVSLRLNVGDFGQVTQLQPKLRPELLAANANITLPEYLELPESVEQDVRSGLLSAVEGSSATVTATASRPLQEAMVDQVSVHIEKDEFRTSEISISGGESRLQMAWRDFDGLAGREPFDLSVKPVTDELPTVVSQGLPRQAVVLNSEQLNFEALAADDFGVKKLGISWKGLEEEGSLTEPAIGEKLISAGGPSHSSMQVPATFTASALGIEPQPIEVRLWAEDYLPGRERVYSAPHVLFVLSAEDHAVWITSQLSKWHRSALDVRDKELQLHENNKRLRTLTVEELGDEEMRKELRRQASLEAANGRRLTGLARGGEDLLRQASRNPEIGVGHLDRWAEMLQVLNDIGSNRMPSVSDLLAKASSKGKIARGGMKSKSSPMAGNSRSGGGAGGPPSEERKDQPEQPAIPKILDGESSMQPNDQKPGDENKKPKKKFSGSKQGLVTTTLNGPPPPEGDQQEEQEEEEDEPIDQAIIEQADLLAEFAKVADELNTVLANLEGSTLVKRLKAASREQVQVAGKISSRINAVFGAGSQIASDDLSMLKGLTDVEEKSSQQISYIMDDMQAYFERRRMNQFKVVLDEMKGSEVLTALQQLGEEIPKEHGISIAQAEYWADNLDRWAEDLVDPACSGQCPGCKTSDSLPPSLILEVLRILEAEVNLREETRVAERARPAIENEEHVVEAQRQGDIQDTLRERTDQVVTDIEDLPMGADRFAKDIGLLRNVSSVMVDATQILGSGDTGSAAIAAETEAIELLLQCKRINPKSGGGGGASPGGGGKGETQDSALALLGSGLNQNERREARDVTQATGENGRILPEEFRAGLDKYFDLIEEQSQ